MYQGWVQPQGLDNKTCWLNSFTERYLRSDSDNDYAYAEGFAVRRMTQDGYTGLLGQFHGWNMRKGHVYDTTYGRAAGTRYYGVVFSDEFLRFTGFMTGYGMSLLRQFELVWPYLDNYAANDWRLITKG